MSAETFTTAMFLITAVIAAGVLINAVFPVVYNMAGTFSSSTHASDERLRTDFKIVTMHAKEDTAQIWMKNIGSSRIAISDITNRSDVILGVESVNYYNRLTWDKTGAGSSGTWTVEFGSDYDINNNNYWDPGETVKITAYSTQIPTEGNIVYFQFVLPGGTLRSTEFTTS
ncbi:MAG: flagellin [Methanoregula sp.]|jgi:flagellar protein FlaG|nr:flagellin [Methanoregula sp.]